MALITRVGRQAVGNVRPNMLRFVSTEPPIMHTIRSELKEAMRQNNVVVKNVMRAIMADIKNANINKAGSADSNLKIHSLITSLISKREKSLEAYLAGNRKDLADVEKAEIDILCDLSKKITIATEDEVDQKVKELLNRSGIDSHVATLGNVMKLLPDVEKEWNTTRKQAAAAVKRILGQRQFSTYSGALTVERSCINSRVSTSSTGKRRQISGVDHVILVSSAKGGVGKSTVAVNLAIALAKHGSTGLLDVDISGPSIPKMLNLKSSPRLADNGALKPLVQYGIEAMSMGFLVPEGSAIAWRSMLVQKALQQLLFQVAWRPLRYLVLDMPPGTGDVQLTVAQTVKVDGAIIVSTPQDVALKDVTRGIDLFRKTDVPILGLVQNMSYFLCPHCHTMTHVFGRDGAIEVSSKLGIEILAKLPMSADISTSGDEGIPVVGSNCPDSKLFEALADEIAARLL